MPINLNNLDDNTLYTQAELSELIGKTAETLRAWRRKGLKYQAGNHRPMYLGSDVKKYLGVNATS